MAETKTYTTMGELDEALKTKRISIDDYFSLKKGIEVKGSALTVKHGSAGKGNVSVYGLQAKFPVTLYPSQWRRLIDEGIPQIEQFLKDEAKNIADEDYLKRYATEKAAEREKKEKAKAKSKE